MKQIACSLFGLLLALPSLASLHRVHEPSRLPDTPKELYLDLMKRTLANTIYEDQSFLGPFVAHMRSDGSDHPTVAHTMIGMQRLNNLQALLSDVIANNVPGDVIETGVWRGGATIFMRAVLKAHGDTTRKVWVADSFEGLPPPDVAQFPKDAGLNLHEIPYLAVSLEQVQDNFRKYGLLDDQVIFLKGFFKDTLTHAPIDKLAILRLDGDLYESTTQALEALYAKVSPGGYVIIDDFGAIRQCAEAVHDFRARHSITQPLEYIDFTGVYWKKT